MPDFDINHLKKTWQENRVDERYSQNEILKMLNRKSRSYVKYIFWISVAEFLVFLAIGLWYVFESEDDNSLIKILQKIGVKKTFQVQMDFEHLYFLMKVVSLLTTAFFVVKFALNYRKIKVEEDLKLLIVRIIRFRKTVRQYITANFVLIFLYLAAMALFIYKVLTLQNIRMDNPTLIGFCIGMVVAMLLSLLLLWAYYRLVYGILTRRLGQNMEQLKEIERSSAPD